MNFSIKKFFSKCEEIHSQKQPLEVLYVQRCSYAHFAKFLRTPFLQNTSGRLFLHSADLSTFKELLLEKIIFCAVGRTHSKYLVSNYWSQTKYTQTALTKNHTL